MLVYTRPGIEKITLEGNEPVDFIHIPIGMYIYDLAHKLITRDLSEIDFHSLCYLNLINIPMHYQFFILYIIYLITIDRTT